MNKLDCRKRNLTVRYSQCMTIMTSHTLRSLQFIREVVSALTVREELFSLYRWKSTMSCEDFFLEVKETLIFVGTGLGKSDL